MEGVDSSRNRKKKKKEKREKKRKVSQSTQFTIFLSPTAQKTGFVSFKNIKAVLPTKLANTQRIGAISHQEAKKARLAKTIAKNHTRPSPTIKNFPQSHWIRSESVVVVGLFRRKC